MGAVPALPELSLTPRDYQNASPALPGGIRTHPRAELLLSKLAACHARSGHIQTAQEQCCAQHSLARPEEPLLL